MTSIQPAAERLVRLLGEQKPDPACMYRPSKYCVRVPAAEGSLVYHTLTGALWLIPKEESTEENRDALIRGWALVPEGFDERKQTDDLRRLARMLWKPKNRTRFTILTTTDCNARCFYCFEMGARRFPMTEETAARTAEYIASVCGGEKVRLIWFGGEPLYNRQAMAIITDGLRERGIDFSSDLISNGYYLDRETVETAVRDWNVESVQITLDGTKEVYRRTKAYIERDADPLSRVLDNIDTARQAGIRVHIRLNMDRKNAEDLMDLADVLAERFPDKAGLQVYVSILRNFTGLVHDFAAEEEENEKALALRRRLTEHGLYRPEPLPQGLRLTHCIADQEEREEIFPDGRIVTCNNINTADTVGSIASPARDPAVVRAWKETLTFPACESCALYPRCIMLKKCPWVKEGCSDAARAMKKIDLDESILAVYDLWKNKKRKDLTE